MAFDPFNLLLLAIAAVVFWRLRSVLGARTGSERPPFDPFGSKSAKDGTAAEPANANVLRFPKEDGEEPAKPQPGEEPAKPIWHGLAEAGSLLAKGLEDVAAADKSFAPQGFIEGGKLAYEMIVEAFARGDKQSLKPLLSREVFDGFAQVIDQREARGERIDQRFVGIDKAAIAGASLQGRKARITMRFVSELISATLSKSGEVIEGDPREIRQITDIWTFERDTNSRDPNWKLVATEVPT
jgi:predicted lipid-binding transport protein (Tim44 family)